jgi:DNA-binding LytR/AlgR family response regulator
MPEAFKVKAFRFLSKPLKSEELMETPYPLKYWQDKLETSDFFQVHKSYLVSLRYVCNIETDTVLLRGVEDGIPLSRRKSAQLKQVFFEYVKEHAHYI